MIYFFNDFFRTRVFRYGERRFVLSEFGVLMGPDINATKHDATINAAYDETTYQQVDAGLRC